MTGKVHSAFIFLFLASAGGTTYEEGSDVQVSMNKVWPLSNPTETYRYYDFPFCEPDEIMPHFMTLGQVLGGDRLVNSIYHIDMQKNLPRTVVCKKEITEKDIQLFKSSIDANYMFELFVSDVPIIQRMGVKSNVNLDGFGNIQERYFLVNYLDFVVGHNGGEVVFANVTSELNLEHLIDITTCSEDMVISYSYSVNWVKSDIVPGQAMKMQLKSSMPLGHMNMNIHWLAIINSFVLTLLIFSFLLLIIIRFVRSDLLHFLQMPDEDLMSLSAMIGAGVQLLIAIVMVILVRCLGTFYQRGALASAAVVSYMVSAAVSGYFSAHLYHKLGGEKWAWNIFATALTFVLPGFFCGLFLNTVAIGYGSTAAFPFSTMLLIFAMWACVTIPLTVLGGIVGRHRAATSGARESPFPCKSNKLEREIPQ